MISKLGQVGLRDHARQEKSMFNKQEVIVLLTCSETRKKPSTAIVKVMKGRAAKL